MIEFNFALIFTIITFIYFSEHGSPAFDEFLELIGDKVKMKGFNKYRAQLDNKSKFN